MIFRDAFDLIFPRLCHICEAPLDDEEEFICTPCRVSLPRTGYHTQRNNRFEERFAGIFPFERGTAHFFYDRNGDLAQLVHDFKYRGFPSLARTLGRLMGRELHPTGFLDDVDVIVPVGMHYLKRWKRGYNQALELAKGLTEMLVDEAGMDVEIWDCLTMSRMHRSQTRRTGEDRAKSMRDIFRVRRGYDLTGHTVLLLDDICTTGSTMTAAAEALHLSALPPGLPPTFYPQTPPFRLRLLTLACTY